MMNTADTPSPPPAVAEVPFIAATRSDGLGGRLVALMNALWLSDQTGLPCRFNWSRVDGEDRARNIPPAHLLFSESFMAAHHRPLGALASTLSLSDPMVTRARIDSLLGKPQTRGLTVEICWTAARFEGVAADPGALQDIWARIGWNAQYRALEAAARDAVPKGTVAVHIRRGDLVYSGWRRGLFSAKFRPLAWFRHAVERLCAEGRPVLVFGDTPGVVDALCDGLPVQRGDELRPEGLTGFEAAFFELSAMAACDSIIGSGSVFATLAGMTAGTKTELPEHSIPWLQQAALVRQDLAERPDRYTPLERAKELVWLTLNRPAQLASGEAETMIEDAARLDPDNDLITLVRARLHCLAGEWAEADRCFETVAERLFIEKSRTELRLFGLFDARGALAGCFDTLTPADLAPFAYLATYYAEMVPQPPRVRVALLRRAHENRPESDFLRANFCAALLAAGDLTAAGDCLAERLIRPAVPPLLWRLKTQHDRLVRALGTHEAELLSLIARLRPVALDQPLVRIGSEIDGGYLLPDDLEGIAALISPGTGREVSFDLALAERGIPVFMADKSVAGPPVSHERFVFEQKYLGTEDGPDTVRLETLSNRAAQPAGDLVLQMDIEGAEFPLLLDAAPEVLGRFRIMVIEFHGLGRLLAPETYDFVAAAFERLLLTHQVVHIHPNNCAPARSLGSAEVAPVMEFTFYRRDRVRPVPEARLVFPHPLDADNLRDRPPVPLPSCWRPDWDGRATSGPPVPVPAAVLPVEAGGIAVAELAALLGPRAKTIVELGANIGQTTRDFVRHFPEADIYCFEPEPRAIAQFRKTITSPKVRLVEAAIGAENGSARFFQSDGPGDEGGWNKSGSLRAPKMHLKVWPWVKFDAQIEVPVVRLDDWAKRQGLNDIDLIWADVQGAEGDLIEGGREVLSRTRLFYTEYGTSEWYEGQVTFDEICRRLAGLGFEPLRRFTMDALFVNRRLMR